MPGITTEEKGKIAISAQEHHSYPFVIPAKAGIQEGAAESVKRLPALPARTRPAEMMN